MRERSMVVRTKKRLEGLREVSVAMERARVDARPHQDTMINIYRRYHPSLPNHNRNHTRLRSRSRCNNSSCTTPKSPLPRPVSCAPPLPFPHSSCLFIFPCTIPTSSRTKKKPCSSLGSHKLYWGLALFPGPSRVTGRGAGGGRKARMGRGRGRGGRY